MLEIYKLTSVVFVHNAPHWALYHVWFQKTLEVYDFLISVVNVHVYTATEPQSVYEYVMPVMFYLWVYEFWVRVTGVILMMTLCVLRDVYAYKSWTFCFRVSGSFMANWDPDINKRYEEVNEWQMQQLCWLIVELSSSSILGKSYNTAIPDLCVKRECK